MAATRTWVSGLGDDANPCSRTAPGKTFAGAISKTAAGGEISVLDPGGYGAITITKSVTINGDGTLASILSAGTNGAVINAGTLDTIVFRNISINGAGTGLNGVRYLKARAVYLENCTIANVTTHGVDVNVSGDNGTLIIRNTVIRNCGQNGINVIAAAGLVVRVVLDNVSIDVCGVNAFRGGSGCRAIIRNTVLSVSQTGVRVEQSGGAGSDDPRVVLERACIFGCFTVAVHSGPGAPQAQLSGCSVTNNTTGITTSGSGSVLTAQNNLFSNNTNGAATGNATIL